MCGIVGVISKYTSGLLKQHEDMFNQLLYVNALRGDDSTGIIGVEKDSSFHIMKEATEAAWFAQTYKGSDMERAMFARGKALVGHNRKKTVGKIEDQSAHPFVINDEFAMVHNGTLYNHKSLKDTEVDSEALAHVFYEAFAEEDYAEKFAETLGKVSGAYAVSMYDQRTNTVRLFRNKERPLAYVSTDNGWYYASEAPMLFWILLRNGYDPKKFEIKVVPEFTLLSFDLDKNELKEEKIEPKKPIPQYTKAATGVNTVKTFTKIVQTSNKEGLSKNAYKRFRRKHIGTKIEWWVEDYIEANFPALEEQGETEFRLMGSSDKLKEDHMVVSTVDLKPLNLTSSKLDGTLWSGRVVDVLYDTKARRATLVLENSAPLPIAFKPSKHTVIGSKYIQDKLDEQEKALVTLH